MGQRKKTATGRLTAPRRSSRLERRAKEIRRAGGRPHGLGFNGHAKVCDCDLCAPLHVKRITDYLHSPTVKLGRPGATILVRAHLRRGRHFTKRPNTLGALRYELKLLRQRGEEV